MLACFKGKRGWFMGTIVSRFKPMWLLPLELHEGVGCIHPCFSLLQLKEKITLTFKNIPEPMVQKAIYGMKKWAKKQVDNKSLRVKKSVFRRKWLKTRNLSKIMIYQYKLVIIIMKLDICQLQKVLIQLIFEISQANFHESLRSWTF